MGVGSDRLCLRTGCLLLYACVKRDNGRQYTHGGRGRIYSLTIAIPEAVRIITPYLGGYLIAVYILQPAMRLGYSISTVVGLVVAFIRIRYLKDTIKGEAIGWNIPKIFIEGYRNVLHSIQWIYANVRGYINVAMPLTLIGSIVVPFWVVYATGVIKLSAYDWGLVMLIGGITKTIGSLIIGEIIDRVGARKTMLASFIIAIPCMTLFTYVTSFWMMVPIYICLVISSSLMWISSSVYLANSILRTSRGRTISALCNGMSIGVTGGEYSSRFLIFIPMAIGSKLGGMIYTINPAWPWYIQSSFLIVGAVLCYLLIKGWVKNEE